MGGRDVCPVCKKDDIVTGLGEVTGIVRRDCTAWRMVVGRPVSGSWAMEVIVVHRSWNVPRGWVVSECMGTRSVENQWRKVDYVVQSLENVRMDWFVREFMGRNVLSWERRRDASRWEGRKKAVTIHLWSVQKLWPVVARRVTESVSRNVVRDMRVTITTRLARVDCSAVCGELQNDVWRWLMRLVIARRRSCCVGLDWSVYLTEVRVSVQWWERRVTIAMGSSKCVVKD